MINRDKIDIQDPEFWEWLTTQTMNAAKTLPLNGWAGDLYTIAKASLSLKARATRCLPTEEERHD